MSLNCSFLSSFLFLFHTGSIRGTPWVLFRTHDDRFLFHTGSIRGPPHRLHFFIVATFLFHTGSIRGSHTQYRHSRCPRFLFHTGSIRGDATFPTPEILETFLFHTGSIRGLRQGWLAVAGFGFYSILVRLEASYGSANPCCIPRVSIPYWFD